MAPVTQFEDPEYLEAVFSALFDKLKGATFPDGITLKSSARVVVPPDSIPPADQPALIQIQGPQHAEQRELFGPTKWIFTAIAAVYLRADTSALNPANPSSPLPITTANRVVWALTQALGNTQPPYQKQTLGGLVYHCWIEGEVIPEVVDQQMVITIPINILPGPVG